MLIVDEEGRAAMTVGPFEPLEDASIGARSRARGARGRGGNDRRGARDALGRQRRPAALGPGDGWASRRGLAGGAAGADLGHGRAQARDGLLEAVAAPKAIDYRRGLSGVGRARRGARKRCRGPVWQAHARATSGCSSAAPAGQVFPQREKMPHVPVIPTQKKGIYTPEFFVRMHHLWGIMKCVCVITIGSHRCASPRVVWLGR